MSVLSLVINSTGDVRESGGFMEAFVGLFGTLSVR